MPSPRNAKTKRGTASSSKKRMAARRAFAKKSSGGKFARQGKNSALKRKKITRNNPDIKVKKTTYSKAARHAVLVNADARQRLIEMGGENTISIIREFDQDMSDEELARKTSIKASDVRVVLNRLHSEGLFTYTRVRDRDSGWYTYIWKLCDGKLKEFVDEFAPHEAGGETTVDMEGDAYFCPNCAPEKLVAFEDASETQFKCVCCGSDMSFFERKRK